MGQPDGFTADPPRMRSVGSAIAESARTIKAGFDRQQETLAPGPGVAPGWAAAESARAAARSWDGFVAELHRAVAGLGDSITTAAAHYERTDSDAAARTDRAGRSVPR